MTGYWLNVQDRELNHGGFITNSTNPQVYLDRVYDNKCSRLFGLRCNPASKTGYDGGNANLGIVMVYFDSGYSDVWNAICCNQDA